MLNIKNNDLLGDIIQYRSHDIHDVFLYIYINIILVL
jgi:hypothetical protein